MSFAAKETSSDQGRPVELLQLNYSQRQWFYTTAETPITHLGDVYEPLPIKRSKLQPTGDATKASMTFSVPHDTPVGDLFRIRPPSEIVTVALFAEHYLDGDFQTIWKGRVLAVNWQYPWLDLVTENVFSSLRRLGLRRRYSAQCGRVLYQCGVDKDAVKVTGSVDAITGAVVSVSEISAAIANYYAGGYAEWVNGNTGAQERQMILSSTAGTVTLPSTPVGLSVGASVDLFPGCDHSLTMCHDKFGNSLNNGSTPFIPQKNPFAGSTMY